MRTVHETEALRPSDPIAKSQVIPPGKMPRLKLIVSAKPPVENGEMASRAAETEDSLFTVIPIDHRSSTTTAHGAYPADLHLTSEEATLAPDKLFRLLRRQLHWMEEERKDLESEIKVLEQKRKREWTEKELLLENVMEAELAYHTRRGGERNVDERKLLLIPERLPLIGSDKTEEPWYRNKEMGSAAKAPQSEELQT